MRLTKSFTAASAILTLVSTTGIQAEEQIEIVIPEDEVIQIEEEITIEMDGDAEAIVIDEGPTGADDTIEITIDEPESESIEIEIPGGETEAIAIEAESSSTTESNAVETEMAASADSGSFGLDRVWVEHSVLLEDHQGVNSLSYAHASVKGQWDLSDHWEAEVAARLDGYRQSGNADWHDLDLDYGETFLRYRQENYHLTVGAQKVIWGRIDEVPPTDRLSTMDFRRFIVDDLQDRRLARPMVRLELFGDDSKTDLIYMPTFRETELADTNSIWFPIDRARGKIIGMEVAAPVAAAMPASTIINDAPADDHAVGLRYSSSTGEMDYSMSLQHGRQTMPYFSYSAGTNTFTARYPRSLSVGGDLEFESDGTTWRFEAVYQSDVPVTTKTLAYKEVSGIGWATGMEFYPGDGNTRVNLQLTGTHLLNANNVAERDNVYNLNGSLNIPFAQERWRANVRFFLGLDKTDVYVNPELAFVGWEPHEIYLESHYFDGDKGTIGDFHQDHTMVTLGWRSKF